MIATNEKKVGRNEPCPCGSGEKYKRCCGDESAKALREENAGLRKLVHIFLTQIQGLTGMESVGVARSVYANYPDSEINVSQDPKTGDLSFWVEMPTQRRIILPR